MTVPALNHHRHDHGHGPSQDHAHPPVGVARAPQRPARSLLRLSAARRLAGVFVALILLWAAVAWALA